MKVLVTQSCPTPCDSMDCSPPGSFVRAVLWQEYWSGLPFPAPGYLTYSRIEPASLAYPALAGEFFTTVTWEALNGCFESYNILIY